MEATDIIKVINGAGFVALPFIAALFGLDWYFTRRGKSTKAVFIGVGGILSAVLYSYLVWTEPAPILIEWSIVWYLTLAALAIVVYYGFYEAYGGNADPPAPGWLLPAALLSYICLLSALGVFCAAALARREYLLLAGTVSSEAQPVPNAIVILQDARYAPLRETLTNSSGRFLLALKYTDFSDKPVHEKPARLFIQADGFYEDNPSFDGHSNEHLKLGLTRRSHESSPSR